MPPEPILRTTRKCPTDCPTSVPPSGGRVSGALAIAFRSESSPLRSSFSSMGRKVAGLALLPQRRVEALAPVGLPGAKVAGQVDDPVEGRPRARVAQRRQPLHDARAVGDGADARGDGVILRMLEGVGDALLHGVGRAALAGAFRG